MFLENILCASLGFVWTQTGKKKIKIQRELLDIGRRLHSRLFNNACFERRQHKNSDQIFNVDQDTLHSSCFSFFFVFLKQSEAGQENIKPHFAHCFLTDSNEKNKHNLRRSKSKLLHGSAWLPASVGGTVNNPLIGLHYSGGDFCAFERDQKPSAAELHCVGVR